MDWLSLRAPWPPKNLKTHPIALKLFFDVPLSYTMLGFARWFLIAICAGTTDRQTFFLRRRLDGDERSCPNMTNAGTNAVFEDRCELLLETR